MMKRIALLFETTGGPWGGGNSFLRSLHKAWMLQGIEISAHLDNKIDGVLMNSSYRAFNRRLYPKTVACMVKSGYEQLWPSWFGCSRWRRLGYRPPFVHRLDGVFRLYGRRPDDPADRDQVLINRHADWTIYQTEFCRQSFANEGADVTNSTVIVNGVDTNRFYPNINSPINSTFKLVAVSWSSNMRKGFASLVAAARIPGIELTFIGNWPQGFSSGNVKIIPPQTHEVLPEHLRHYNAMIHMAENEPCSNAILEGLASGLPVIHHMSGGSPEIVAGCGVDGTLSLEQAVAELRDRYTELREKTMARREEISIDAVAQKYLGIFEKTRKITL